MEGLAPDLTLILDLDPESGLQRALDRGEDATRFERHGLDFHRALRQGFLDIARAEPVRCAVIDSSQPPETVLGAALAVIDARLGAGR
jgi:dTMP kinase